MGLSWLVLIVVGRDDADDADDDDDGMVAEGSVEMGGRSPCAPPCSWAKEKDKETCVCVSLD
jgi:hypothetical protein